eukprot:m.25958 g.25958  ORF g.25958 m.25958 type:complete len:240 (-) comp4225_c0_seq2:143-862(-)
MPRSVSKGVLGTTVLCDCHGSVAALISPPDSVSALEFLSSDLNARVFAVYCSYMIMRQCETGRSSSPLVLGRVLLCEPISRPIPPADSEERREFSWQRTFFTIFHPTSSHVRDVQGKKIAVSFHNVLDLLQSFFTDEIRKVSFLYSSPTAAYKFQFITLRNGKEWLRLILPALLKDSFMQKEFVGFPSGFRSRKKEFFILVSWDARGHVQSIERVLKLFRKLTMAVSICHNVAYTLAEE